MSHNLLALGAKAFAQDRLDDAMTHYEEAIRFNRDNTIAYWNLARLRVLNNMLEEARHCYDVTKNMISLIHPKLQIPLSKNIENEIEHTSKGNRKHIRRPVLSLYR
jgi:tetratricopeptide (TPR) repeat protein